jgi:aspartyl-tRNA(Asn)/glutamyl-tRNA(Gln) amidotransferase subunit A
MGTKPSEIVRPYIENIEKYNHLVNAIVHKPDYRYILDTIDTIKPTSLASYIPITYKDNICTTNLPTTCCSKILKGYMSPFNASVVDRLENNGLINLGKTNMDEFAMGAATDTGCYGAAKNPYNILFTSGGSSGGSAVAVACDFSVIALGSDTGGSVRVPAALCGIIGFKPTYGIISRYGMIAFASSLDQIGIMGKYAFDIAYIGDLMIGQDIKDATTVDISSNFFSKSLGKTTKNLVIGIDEEVINSLEDHLKVLFYHTIKELRYLGYILKSIKLPNLLDAVRVYFAISSCEAVTNLARFDGIKYGEVILDYDIKKSDFLSLLTSIRTSYLGNEVKKRLTVGSYLLSNSLPSGDSLFTTFTKYRRFFQHQLDKIYENVDLIFLPCVSDTAKSFKSHDLDFDKFTVLANLVGAPAISIPLGIIDELPFSGQFMANRFKDDLLIQVADLVLHNKTICTPKLVDDF